MYKILYDNGEICTASPECFNRMGFKKGKTFTKHILGKDVTFTEYHTTHKTVSVKDGEYRRAFVYPNGHMVLDGSSSVLA